MGENTKIEWADHSWSPWRGCTKVSPGCANCYAEVLSRRNPAVLGQWGKGAPRVLAKNWNDPVRWNKAAAPIDMENAIGEKFTVSARRPRVFPSLCDWLDEEVPVEWLGRFLHLISMTPHLDWLLLTKRPELWDLRMAKVGSADMPWAILGRAWRSGDVPKNVWFGVSVEDQKRAAYRLPYLLAIPAAVRWLSVEPLIGQIQFLDAVSGRAFEDIQWVVVGGESGHGARPCNIDWVRSIVAQCQYAEVPVFVKQLGAVSIAREFDLWKENGSPEGWRPGNGYVPRKLKDPKGGDENEWPLELRRRQFPLIPLRSTSRA